MTNIGFDEFQHQQSHAFHFRCVGNLPWKFKALQVLTKIYVELKYIIYHTGKGGIAAWIEDDFCDDINNKKECHYDGGDCCGLSVQNNFCVDCKCKCKWNTDKINDDFTYYNTWIPSAIDSDSLKPLSVLHSKLKFEWLPIFSI